MPIVGSIQSADVRLDRSVVGAVRTQRATVERAVALAVAAGGDVVFKNAGCGPMAVGGSVRVEQGGCGPVAAGGDVSVTEGGCGPVVAGGSVTLRDAFVPVAFCGGDVYVEDGGRIGLSVRTPLALAVVAGAVAGLVLGMEVIRRRP